MKYERITDPFVTNEVLLQMEEEDLSSDDKCYIRLSELEDKIEAGTLIELPCKVGDTVFIIAKQGMDIYTVEKTKIVGFWFNQIDDRLYPISASGITLNEIFRTKAEAEKQLKELRGER